MEPSDETLLVCGIPRSEFESYRQNVLQHFGRGQRAIIEHEQRSFSGINLICERSALIEQLSSVNGFSSIKKTINDTVAKPSKGGDDSHGNWFHLRVAYILLQLGEEISLEQKVVPGGSPKDIILRDGNVIVECKSFTIGDEFDRNVHQYLKRGIRPAVDSDTPPEFTHSIGFLGVIPGRPQFSTINLNEFRRFFSNGLEDKKRQAVPGRCNIIAVTGNVFPSYPRDLTLPISCVLELEGYKDISAVWIVRPLPFADWTQRGTRFMSDLVENPHYRTGGGQHRVPEDLAKKIVGEFFIGYPHSGL